MARSTRLVIMIKNILCIYGVGNASYCLLHVTCYCGSYSFEARVKFLTEMYCSHQYLSIDGSIDRY